LVVCFSAYAGYNYGRQKYVRNNKVNLLRYANGNRNIGFASVIFILISVVSLCLYASGYGGIIQTMLKGGQIRASFIQSTNSYTFFKHLIPISIVSSLLLYTDIYINKNHKIIIFKTLLLIVSFAISIIYITANDGRGLAGIYLLLFILINIRYKYEIRGTSINKTIYQTCIVCILIFIIIIQSENWLNIFREHEITESQHSALETILSEFKFIYVGLYTSIYTGFNSISEFTIFNDLLNGVFAWLPTSLKPILLEDVWDYNTRLINDGGYGQSPVNIVGQSFYDLGIIGIFVIPFTYAYIIGKLERYFINDYSTSGVVFSTVLAFYLAKGMAYFSFYNIMMNIFFIVLSWCIYRFWISKLNT